MGYDVRSGDELASFGRGLSRVVVVVGLIATEGCQILELPVLLDNLLSDSFSDGRFSGMWGTTLEGDLNLKWSVRIGTTPDSLLNLTSNYIPPCPS